MGSATQNWLQLEYAECQQEIDTRVSEILARGQFLRGPEVEELEVELARRCGVAHAVTCASGSDALVLALLALGVGRGDAVYTPAFGFVAGAEAIVRVGASPLFVDVDPRTFNLDASALRRAVVKSKATWGSRAGTVLALDLFGVPADFPALRSVCSAFGLKLIEDAAQAFGASIGQQVAGAEGELATLSFFPTKPLGAFGDGGAVLTHNGSLAEAVRTIAAHGWGTERHYSLRSGMNSRLDTIQAGILLEKLSRVDRARGCRTAIARRFTAALPESFTPPFIPETVQSAWAQYCVLAPCRTSRTRLIEHLQSHGIAAEVYYRSSLPCQPAFREYFTAAVHCPVSERLPEIILALPIHAHMPEADIARTVTCLRSYNERLCTVAGLLI